jgi:hypothetical protein
MNKIILSIAVVSLLWSCKSASTTATIISEVNVTIDIDNVKEDKVLVTVKAPQHQ